MEHVNAHHVLTPKVWREIADSFGHHQRSYRLVQDRWYSSVRPGFDLYPLTSEERRTILTLYCNHPGNWRLIASELSNGVIRSPAVVQRRGMRLINKVKRLGFHIETASDVAFIPDAVFEPRGGSAADLGEFLENKARNGAMVAREAVIEAGWGLGSLLAKN
jgi:hypothetical protein